MSQDLSVKKKLIRKVARADRLARLQKPWLGFEALVSLLLTVTLPLAILIWLRIANKLNWLSDYYYNILRNDSIIASIFALAISLLVEFAILYYFVRRYKLSLRDFGIKQFSIYKALMAVIIFYLLFGLTVYMAYLFIQTIIPQIDLDETQKTGFEFGRHGMGLVASGLVTVGLAPIIEEIYFRGFLLPAFSKRYFWVGALVSSLLFGLMHFQPNVIIYTFLFGLFLSYMYYRLGSIIPGIILHMLNNLVAFLILLNT